MALLMRLTSPDAGLRSSATENFTRT
jgi:hypothetical protein